MKSHLLTEAGKSYAANYNETAMREIRAWAVEAQTVLDGLAANTDSPNGFLTADERRFALSTDAADFAKLANAITAIIGD